MISNVIFGGVYMIELIKFIRNRVEMSQQEFADELRIAFATVNRWENGKTTPPPSAQKAIYQFCLKYNVPVADFIISFLTEQREKLEKENPNTKIFFHGSKSGIEGDIAPISRSQCDFGKGFYMGTEVLQPLTLICNYEKPILYFASIDKSDLEVLELPTDISWAFIVAYNRGKLERAKEKNVYKKYADYVKNRDLIIGDIADDRMFYVLDNFFEGNITDKGLVECLSTLQLGQQYVAVSTKACKKIKILKEYKLSELELMALKDISEENRQIGIKNANEICKQYRREGKFFDELLEENK